MTLISLILRGMLLAGVSLTLSACGVRGDLVPARPLMGDPDREPPELPISPGAGRVENFDPSDLRFNPDAFGAPRQVDRNTLSSTTTDAATDEEVDADDPTPETEPSGDTPPNH